MATRAVHKFSRRGASQAPSVEHILSTLRDHLPELQDAYGVCYLGLFGSYVRGEAKRKSDLDLLVEFDRAPTMFEFIRLERRIGELLGAKVDLVMRTALKPAIGARILEEVVPV